MPGWRTTSPPMHPPGVKIQHLLLLTLPVGVIVATIPVKRLGTPEEIGAMIGWIASEDAGFATGADFSLNGGLHMG